MSIFILAIHHKKSPFITTNQPLNTAHNKSLLCILFAWNAQFCCFYL